MIGNACNTNNIHEAITSANPQAQTDIVGYISFGQHFSSLTDQATTYKSRYKIFGGACPQVQVY